MLAPPIQQEGFPPNATFWDRVKMVQQGSGMSKSSAIGTVLLTQVQDDYAESLGVELGGEFRVAWEYCQNHRPICILGDRPLKITLLRAWESLSWWGKAKCMVALLWSSWQKPNPEELREWMQSILLGESDVLTESMTELRKAFPSLERVILKERDAYLACKIYQTCRYLNPRENHTMVAIVGAGHGQGICQWLTDGNGQTPEQILSEIVQTNRHKNVQYLVKEVTQLPYTSEVNHLDAKSAGVLNFNLRNGWLFPRFQETNVQAPCDPQLSNCNDGNEGHGHVLLGGSDEMNHDNKHNPWEQRELQTSSSSKPWGPALLAALIVNLCTLVGVLIFIPASLFSRKVSTPVKKNVLHIVIPSFACGALAATAIFLLVPEALHLIGSAQGGEEEEEHEHRELASAENQTAWKFGAAVLGGYFIPFVFAGVFPHSHVPDDEDIVSHLRADNANVALTHTTPNTTPDATTETSHKEEKENDPIKDVELNGEVKDEDELDSNETTDTLDLRETMPVIVDYQLAASILIGDFFHNFADGVFIGTAFLLCSSTIGTTVAASTIFHELSQELADYFLLTNQCGLSPVVALTLNFISGLSVMFGVIVILATDVSDQTMGILLSMSAGVYFYIAFTECAPRIGKYITDAPKRVLSFLFWVVGAVPISLVLLSHEHCE